MCKCKMEIIEQDKILRDFKSLLCDGVKSELTYIHDYKNKIHKKISCSWKVYSLQNYIYFGLGKYEHKLCIVKVYSHSKIRIERVSDYKHDPDICLDFRLKSKVVYFKHVDVFWDSKVLESVRASTPWFKDAHVNVMADSFLDKIQRFPELKLYEFLFNQDFFYGLKSYLISESLYRAKLKFNKKIGDLSRDILLNLYTSICTILEKSYALDGIGTSLNGDKGEFSRNFQVFEKMQDKNGNKVFKYFYKEYRIFYVNSRNQIK